MEMKHGIALALAFAIPMVAAYTTVGQHHKQTIRKETMQHLKGKNVILTGASGGLGKSFALQLSRCNVKTLVLSGRNLEALKDVQRLCTDNVQGDEMAIYILPCDLSDKQAVNDFSENALRLCNNEVHVLLNNGGISSRSSFLETALDVDELLMRVNFFSGAAIAKAVVPRMVASTEPCHIIWVSSIQGLLGTPFRTSYAASKFAVQGYCEALRSELKTDGVTVAVASPGYIRTSLSRSAIQGDGSLYGKMDKNTEQGVDPDEVAKIILDSAISENKTDFTVAATASAKIGLWLKFFTPKFLESMLVKRFLKQKEESKI